jgi:hypothetical protein
MTQLFGLTLLSLVTGTGGCAGDRDRGERHERLGERDSAQIMSSARWRATS